MSLTRHFRSINDFSRFVERAAVEVVPITTVAAKLAHPVLRKNVRSMFGESPPLAPISQDSTAQMRSDGGAGGPLLIDGSLLRDNIESGQDGPLSGVGSARPEQAYHEMGYITAPNSMIPNKIVPPRPIILEGLLKSEPEITKINEELVGAVLGVATVTEMIP